MPPADARAGIHPRGFEPVTFGSVDRMLDPTPPISSDEHRFVQPMLIVKIPGKIRGFRSAEFRGSVLSGFSRGVTTMPAVTLARFRARESSISTVPRNAARRPTPRCRRVLDEFGELAVRRTSDFTPGLIVRWLADHADRRPATNRSYLGALRAGMQYRQEARLAPRHPLGYPVGLDPRGRRGRRRAARASAPDRLRDRQAARPGRRRRDPAATGRPAGFRR